MLSAIAVCVSILICCPIAFAQPGCPFFPTPVPGLQTGRCRKGCTDDSNCDQNTPQGKMICCWNGCGFNKLAGGTGCYPAGGDPCKDLNCDNKKCYKCGYINGSPACVYDYDQCPCKCSRSCENCIEDESGPKCVETEKCNIKDVCSPNPCPPCNDCTEVFIPCFRPPCPKSFTCKYSERIECNPCDKLRCNSCQKCGIINGDRACVHDYRKCPCLCNSKCEKCLSLPDGPQCEKIKDCWGDGQTDPCRPNPCGDCHTCMSRCGQRDQQCNPRDFCCTFTGRGRDCF